MPNILLSLRSWWGLSRSPGRRVMNLNEDGTFELKEEFHLPKDKENEFQINGIIDSDRMKIISDFLRHSVTEDTTTLIMDAGYTVEYRRGDKVITVKNDVNLWKKIKNLIPEYSASK